MTELPTCPVNFILNFLSVYRIFTDCESDPYGQLFILLLQWKSYYRVMAKGKGGNSSNSRHIRIHRHPHTNIHPHTPINTRNYQVVSFDSLCRQQRKCWALGKDSSLQVQETRPLSQSLEDSGIDPKYSVDCLFLSHRCVSVTARQKFFSFYLLSSNTNPFPFQTFCQGRGTIPFAMDSESACFGSTYAMDSEGMRSRMIRLLELWEVWCLLGVNPALHRRERPRQCMLNNYLPQLPCVYKTCRQNNNFRFIFFLLLS